jgi:uncharacterized protein YcbK (DUF882 family)
MTQFNEYFNRSEFECECGCGYNTVDAELLEVLTIVREHFAHSVTINSGCRCPNHNTKIGGSPRSQHQFGRAADIVVNGVSPAIVFDYLNAKFPNQYGLGSYNTFTHVDTRSNKARWEGK